MKTNPATWQLLLTTLLMIAFGPLSLSASGQGTTSTLIVSQVNSYTWAGDFVFYTYGFPMPSGTWNVNSISGYVTVGDTAGNSSAEMLLLVWSQPSCPAGVAEQLGWSVFANAFPAWSSPYNFYHHIYNAMIKEDTGSSGGSAVMQITEDFTDVGVRLPITNGCLMVTMNYGGWETAAGGAFNTATASVYMRLVYDTDSPPSPAPFTISRGTETCFNLAGCAGQINATPPAYEIYSAGGLDFGRNDLSIVQMYGSEAAMTYHQPGGSCNGFSGRVFQYFGDNVTTSGWTGPYPNYTPPFGAQTLGIEGLLAYNASTEYANLPFSISTSVHITGTRYGWISVHLDESGSCDVDLESQVLFLFVTKSTPEAYYSVTFTEGGLPAGTNWSVTLNATTRAASGSSIAFSEPNGTYSFTITPPSDYNATPALGTIWVSGGSASQGIAFSVAPSGPTISSFSASPSTIAVGSSVTLAVAATGGTGSLSFAYTGLPPGCVSENTTMLRCTPTKTGGFNVTVTVTDAAGRSATSTTWVTVIALSGGGAPGTILGLPPLVAYGIFAAVVAGFVAGILVFAVRLGGKHRIPPGTPPPPSAP